MPRFITCLTHTTPTLRKGADKDNPTSYVTKVPYDTLTLTIESQSDDPVPGTKRIPKRDVEPGGGLHVEFVNGRFEMPYPYTMTNEDAIQLEKALKQCSPPMTVEQAKRKYDYLVNNESGQLGITYQLDPTDEHWKTVDPHTNDPQPDGKSAEDSKLLKIKEEAKKAMEAAPKVSMKK